MDAKRSEFPTGLADLLAGDNLPEHVWTDADRAAVFRHQMNAPVRLELGGLDPTRQGLVRNLLDADPSLLVSLRGLLERRDAPVEVLTLVKAFAKSMAVHPDGTLPRDVAAGIYALTILAARRDGHRLTQHSDDQLRSLAEWVRMQPWVDDATRRLVEQCIGGGDATSAMELSVFAEREWLESRLLDPPLQIGSVASVDGYDVLRVIAEGGMALVMLARSPDDGSPVAIKVMKPSLLDSPRLVQRFVDEARHMAQLDHPNILKVIEWSARRTGPYYVMPYVARGSLAELLRSGPLDAETACSIASQVAEALSVAHLRGITHRDVKPSNILLGDDGRALVSDFGLARTVFNDATLDASSVVLEGSAPYVSPGVAAGQAEDTRCDIYALGATLYEMLTGQPPYRGPSAAEILAQVRAGPPVPVLSVNPRASKALVKVCETCMARDLRDRYATMADVCADLLEIRAGSRPVGRGSKARPLWPVAALVLLAVALAVSLWPRPAAREETPAFASTTWTAPLAPQLQPEMLVTRMFAEGFGGLAVRFSADGRWLLCRAGTWELGWIDQLDARTLEPVRRLSERGSLFDVARDVSRAVVQTDAGFRVVDLNSGDVLAQIPAEPGGTVLSISPDGMRVAFNGPITAGSIQWSLRVFDVASGRQLLDLPITGSRGSSSEFLDADRLLVWTLNEQGIHLVDLTRGGVVQSIRSHALWGPLIRSNDTTVATAGVDSTTQLFDANALEPLGRRLGRRGDPSGLALLSDGRLIVSDTEGGIFAYSPEGPELWRYQHLRPTPTTDVSSDGSRLALMSVEGQLWVYRLPDASVQAMPSPLSVPPAAPGEVLRTAISNQMASSVAVSRDGTTAYIGAIDGELAAVEAEDGSVRWRRYVARSMVRQIVVDVDGSLIVSTTADGVHRLSATDGTQQGVIDPSPAVQVIASAGDSVIVTDGDRFRRVGGASPWSVQTSNFTLDSDVSSDGSVAAFGTNRFAVAIRDVATGELKTRLLGHEGFVVSVRFLQDPTRLVSGATDGSAKLWHWPSGAVVHQFAAGQSLSAVVPIRQDRLLVTTGVDFMKLWDLSSGELVRTYPASRGIRAAAGSRDGRFVWTVGPGPLVRKWFVPEPRPLD